MSNYKYCIGVHGYEPNNAPVNTYSAGELAAYLAALGVGSANGAVAHVKLKDPNGQWSGGHVPAMAAHTALFLSEAKALGFTTLCAWIPESPWNSVDTPAAMAQFDLAAAEAVSENPDVDIWLFGNEREQFGVNEDDNEGDWFYLENRAGQIWQGLGKLWAAGADQSISGFLSTLADRRANYWDSEPDWLALHAYGNGGFTSRNVKDVRQSVEHITGRTWNIVLAEWAVDFENLTGYGTKDWVRDSRAREFNEHVGRALRRERVYGCYFTMKEIVQEAGQLPQQGIIDAISDTQTATNPPSMDPVTAAAVTQRYLYEGAYDTNFWGARWQGAKEYVRSLISYWGYWE